MDFTIVTAVTPDYLPRLIWALPTWEYKPQFKDRPIVVFHSGFNKTCPDSFEFIKKLFKIWTFVDWKMEQYENTRELMLSSFVFGIKDFVKTNHFVKLDCDAYFTNTDDVFSEDDFNYDIVGHKWGYTKPGWWIDKLEGNEVDLNKKIHSHERIASFCCLHKTEFVNKVADILGKRLPVPSHDTVLWWYANKQGKWLGKNLKKLGVDNNTNWKSIRENTCSSESRNNRMFNDILMSKVQLEITTDCNLKCHNCDRVCGVAPSKEFMKIEQIYKFVDESITLKKNWKRIDILGGEPTLYEDLETLWKIIKLYKDKNKNCKIRFSTNGLNEFSVPDWVDVRNSNKKERLQKDHTAFNSAPIDNGETEIKCCSVPWRCGLALTRYGYFLCGAGAAISRVFGFDIGFKNLSNINSESMLNQINTLCKYCGHSRVKSRHIPETQEISKSWEVAINSYKDKRLSLY